MPLVSTDIRAYKSINTDSDGGAIDTGREITSGVLHNLFPQITGPEQVAGGTRYRKFFKRNTHGSLSWTAVRTFIALQPSNATLSIGIGISHADDAEPLAGNMTAFSAAALVALVSDGADTRTVTILGEDASGVFQTENVVLTGASEVFSVSSYTKVYAVYVASLSASRTVSVQQGSGGTVRGTIGLNRKICFLWRTGTDIDTIAEGYAHGTIASAGNFGIWARLVWVANATAAASTNQTVTSGGGTT